jgi:16S rRNA (cytosine967-C5)-methyltransferase
VDFCAAPGGKTGHLWELMRGQGRLVAHEVNAARRKELRENLERLYGKDHRIEIPEGEASAAALATETFDRVLVDAPCQALGLVRRHPEIRWDERLRAQGAMQATQRAVLDAATRLVRPGGRLLWVTCSPTAAENEETVIPWLREHKEWWILNPVKILEPAWRNWVQVDKGVARTRPDQMDCDGFAMILLERLGK